jgi:hypothetical protein
MWRSRLVELDSAGGVVVGDDGSTELAQARFVVDAINLGWKPVAVITGCGMSEAMAQGTVDMLLAKNVGLDNAEPRTPQSAAPTSFRQWYEEVLKPAVLA